MRDYFDYGFGILLKKIHFVHFAVLILFPKLVLEKGHYLQYLPWYKSNTGLQFHLISVYVIVNRSYLRLRYL
jgi:hypothetical protein